MNLDDKVCYCFHISRRKLLTHLRIHQPRVPSQLSECGGAGTGCGWCVPFLRQLFRQATCGEASDLDRISPDEYERLRSRYIREGHGTPPNESTDE